MTNKTILTLFFTFLFLQSFSQPLTPSWEISLPSKVQWMQVNDWGILVASCETGLYGISPADGKKLWEVSSLTNVPEENYQVIEGTPLLMLADKAGTQQTVVINGLNGQIIFDSEKEKLGSIVTRKIIPEVGGLMIAYSNDTEEGVALYDYLSGSKKWTRPFEKSKSKELLPQPLVDAGGNILYALGKNLYKLNGSTGEVLWQAENKKNYIDLFFHPEGGQVFAVSGSASSTFFKEKTGSEIGLASGTAGAFSVESLDAVSGQATWKEPLTYSKSKYSGVALGPADLLLFHTFSTARIGYATGEPLWAKERMGTGGEKNAGIFVTDKGMAFAMQDAVGRNYLHFVNDAGEPLWKKKPVINGDIFFTEQTGNTVFYISTQETNIVNLEDGSLLWQKDKYLSAGNVPISVDREADGNFVMYIRGMLVRVMPARQDWEEIASGFAFNGELPTGLRIMPNGYLLTGNQNAMLLGRDGKVLYHQFYPAPEQSFGAKLALGVAGTAASFTSFAFAVSGLGYGLSGVVEENDSYMKKSQQQFAVAGFSKDVAGGLGALMSARFGEDASANDYKLILTKKDKSIGFVKINLLTGQEEGQIVTDDRTPDFAIDAVGDRVFLKSAPDRVACYGL